ncbi:RING-H2 finger protein ATL11-like [Cornus florida]|uniref:RING-H2 finger protein ATL11-like n=1 Tax=Cornus florida TaxID=4283 RepID=UPI0028A018C2|nr:RING-H2 finger protein ATL11-like [Cornus florida]
MDPEKDHVWVRTKDDDRSNAVAVAVGVCPICLDVMLTETEEDIVVETCCLHVFHKGCISRWLSKSNSCPICRLDLQLLYKGPFLLDAIDSLQLPARDYSKPLLMPLCNVIKSQSLGQVSACGKVCGLGHFEVDIRLGLFW